MYMYIFKQVWLDKIESLLIWDFFYFFIQESLGVFLCYNLEICWWFL